MKRLWIGIGAVALALCWVTPSDAVDKREAGWRKIGDRAPKLDVYFLQGDEVNLAQGRGKHVYIIEFWATWCGPCKYSAPHLTGLQKKYGDAGLVVIGISNEKSYTVRPYMEAMADRMDYTVAIDREGSTTRRYFYGFGLNGSIPKAVVVNAKGKVVWIGNPMNPGLEIAAARALQELAGPVALPEIPAPTDPPIAPPVVETTEPDAKTN